MIMTALVTSSLREEAVDFTFPVGSSPLKILIKVRQDSSLFFLNVFHWQVNILVPFINQTSAVRLHKKG